MTTAEWAYNHIDNVSDKPACMLTAGSDLAERVASMRAQGYVIHAITMHTLCDTCQGSGRVPHKRTRYAWRTCPTCKGHDGPLASAAVDLSML